MRSLFCRGFPGLHKYQKKGFDKLRHKTSRQNIPLHYIGVPATRLPDPVKRHMSSGTGSFRLVGTRQKRDKEGNSEW